jgi:hypothetical protein
VYHRVLSDAYVFGERAELQHRVAGHLAVHLTVHLVTGAEARDPPPHRLDHTCQVRTQATDSGSPQSELYSSDIGKSGHEVPVIGVYGRCPDPYQYVVIVHPGFVDVFEA